MLSSFRLPLKFHLSLLIRLLLLSGNIFLLIFFLEKVRNEYLFVVFALGLIFILQIFLLYQFLMKIEKVLDHFFRSLISDDISGYYTSDHKTKGFEKFKSLLNHINEIIRVRSIAFEQDRILFKMIINEAPSGIILYDSEGVVILHNQVFLKMINLPAITFVSSLDKLKKGLVNDIDELKPGKSITTKIFVEDYNEVTFESRILLIKKSIVKRNNSTLYLLTFSDISYELNKNEVEAWHKLIKVLTHEIMNSISPLSALSQKIEIIAEDDNSEDKMDKILKGIRTIKKSGDYLLSFLDEYKSLSDVPEPKFSNVVIKDFLEHVICLFKGEFFSDNIDLTLEVNLEEMKESMDPALMEKVIFNLLKNSYQSIGLDKDGVIKVAAIKDDDYRTIMRIEDNGKGFTDDIADKIFTPFFTTKKNGSGIGLSISRQIVNLHNGSITAVSLPGKSTIFTIRL